MLKPTTIPKHGLNVVQAHSFSQRYVCAPHIGIFLKPSVKTINHRNTRRLHASVVERALAKWSQLRSLSEISNIAVICLYAPTVCPAIPCSIRIRCRECYMTQLQSGIPLQSHYYSRPWLGPTRLLIMSRGLRFTALFEKVNLMPFGCLSAI